MTEKRKAGRPKGSIKKKEPTQQDLTNHLIEQVRALVAEVGRLQAEIDNLHHQATGYDAVISYLEHKLFGE
jgi:hypothetical protein